MWGGWDFRLSIFDPFGFAQDKLYIAFEALPSSRCYDATGRFVFLFWIPAFAGMTRESRG